MKASLSPLLRQSILANFNWGTRILSIGNECPGVFPALLKAKTLPALQVNDSCTNYHARDQDPVSVTLDKREHTGSREQDKHIVPVPLPSCSLWWLGVGLWLSLIPNGHSCEKQVSSTDSNEPWSAQVHWPTTEETESTQVQCMNMRGIKDWAKEQDEQTLTAFWRDTVLLCMSTRSKPSEVVWCYSVWVEALWTCMMVLCVSWLSLLWHMLQHLAFYGSGLDTKVPLYLEYQFFSWACPVFF